MAERLRVFVVDDDPMHTQMLNDHLGRFKMFEFITFSKGEDALNNLTLNPDIVVLDYHLDSQDKDAMNGLEVLREIKQKKPETEVVILSSQDKIDVAVNTIKYGAFDYVVKSESAFHRMENVFFNIIKTRKLTGEAKTYKTLTIVFAVVLIVAIVVSIILFKSGYITSNPGWM